MRSKVVLGSSYGSRGLADRERPEPGAATPGVGPELLAEGDPGDVGRQAEHADAEELRAILTRPGSGTTAMDPGEAEVILMILTELFDANTDGKLSIAECANALKAQM